MNLLHYICSLGYWRSARNWSIVGIKLTWSWKLQWRPHCLHQNCSKKLEGWREKKVSLKKTIHELTIYIRFHQTHSTSSEIPAVTQAGLVLKLHLYCFESEDSFMPATNPSKITSKNPQASQEFEGQVAQELWNAREVARFSSSSAISSFGWLVWLQTPLRISISLPAWRHQCFVIYIYYLYILSASQKHVELSTSLQPKERRCHGLFLDTLISTEVKLPQNTWSHQIPAPCLLIYAETSASQIVSFFWISFSTN